MLLWWSHGDATGRDSGSLCSSRMQGERGPAADQDWAGMEGLDKGEKGKGGKTNFPFHPFQNRNHQINRKENII